MLQLLKTENQVINGLPTPCKVYKNTVTGSEVTIYRLYTDSQKNTWWTFQDLYQLPLIRQMSAKRVLDLYGNGLSLDDVKALSGQVKTILRSADPEKNDKAIAKMLELEGLTEMMADPVKQCMGLCTVYLMLNEEMPDVWNNNVASQKMSIMALDVQAQSFFLNWWTDIMRHYGTVLKGISQIASTLSAK